MDRVGVEHLCKGCMSFIKNPLKPCPSCGYDNNTIPLDSECLRPGCILNKRYLVGKVINRTPFEFVYIGWDLGINCRVIIREYYSKEYFQRDNTINSGIYYDRRIEDKITSSIDMYFSEANSIMLLGKLEGVISIKDVFKTELSAYCITEYYEATTLENYLESKCDHITKEQLFSMLQPIIYSLATMHQKGIIHGNIGTDTLLVDTNEKILLNVMCRSNVSNYQHTYLDDVQNMCKIVYKIICGTNYMTNIFNFSQSHILTFPDDTPKHLQELITSCLDHSSQRMCVNMFDIYNALYIETTELPKPKKHTNLSLPIRIPQPNFIATEYLEIETSDNVNSLKKSFPSLSFKDIMGLAGIGLCAFILFCACQIILSMKLDSKVQADTNVSASSFDVIVWHDKNLETAVRNILNIQRSDLTIKDVGELTTLDLSNQNIENIIDLKNFTSLVSLNLSNNNISNIRPLVRLKNLSKLDISYNNIRNIAPLKNIQNLSSTNISHNKISDYSSIKHLKNIIR